MTPQILLVFLTLLVVTWYFGFDSGVEVTTDESDPRSMQLLLMVCAIVHLSLYFLGWYS